jgi:iron complex transport system substrate-binding protein
VKICSLLPSGTEIAFALGLGDQVIGVTDICDYPDEAMTRHIVSRSLVDPSVLTSAEVEQKMKELTAEGRSTYELDTQWLYKENPDLILTQDLCYVCDIDASLVFDAVTVLLSQPQVLVLSPRTVSEVFDTITQVGEAAGVRDRADELVGRLQARVNSLVSRTGPSRHKPRVFSLEGINPLVAGGHWIPDMKLLAGGRDDMFSPGCPALRLTWDQVRDYDPEVLFLTLCSSDLKRNLREVHWLARQEGWWDLQAVTTGQVYMIDHIYFSRPGPRIVEGIEILSEITHPEIFTGLIPPDTVMKLDPSADRDCPPEELAGYFRPYPSS